MQLHCLLWGAWVWCASCFVEDVYNSDTPFGVRTTTVPAILSCHDCLSLSMAIHRNPRPTTASDRKQLSARTIAVGQSIGRPSSRTTCRPQMIPPTVEALSFHITAPYVARASSSSLGPS